MAISVLLRALTRRAQFSTSLSSYESVFRSVNTPVIPWTGSILGNTLSTGSRAFCSKPDQNDLAARVKNETERLFVPNTTKVIFKYECASDDPQEDSKCCKIRKIVETPTGDALFGLSKGGDTYYSLSFFYLFVQGSYCEAARSLSRRQISKFYVIVPPYFKQNLDSVEFSSAHDGIFSESGIVAISCDLHDFISTRTREILMTGDRIVLNSGTECIDLTLNFQDFFDVRIWEIITNGEKSVLEIIVGQLKRNGFDFTEDPLVLQKLEQAVDRAIARRKNAVKLNLPVPAGHPEMSTTVSWARSDEFYARSSTSYDSYTCRPH